MDRQALVRSFQDTQAYTRTHLAEETERLRRNTQLYPAGFRSSIRPEGAPRCTPEVVEDTTFHCAQTSGHGRTCVLNFANAYSPGGGVVHGAMAQEECLCRSSNLYASLLSPLLLEAYYQYNRDHTRWAGTDAVIYSPGVTVFKSDDPVPVMLDSPFTVDVITCAAPELFRAPYPVPEDELCMLYDRRNRNILETALSRGVDVLVLGAFGCGAFQNPPEQVAASFRRLLVSENYLAGFDRVIFAIKKNNALNSNFLAFRDAFR